MKQEKKIELDHAKLLGLRHVVGVSARRKDVASALRSGAKVGEPKPV